METFYKSGASLFVLDYAWRVYEFLCGDIFQA